MFKIKKLISFFNKDFFGILFITVIFYLQYGQIIFNTGYIWYNDAAFLYKAIESVDSVFSSTSNSYFFNNQGNALFLYGIPAIIINFLGILISNPMVISKILTFGILYITVVHLYYQVKSVSKVTYIATAIAIIFLTNNSTIEYVQFGGFYYHFFSINGLIIAIFQLYKVLCSGNFKYIDTAIFSLGALLLNHPFYIILYLIVYFTIVLIIRPKISDLLQILKLSIPLIFLTIANLYWLVSFFVSVLSPSLNETYSQNGKFVFEGFKTVANPFNILRFGNYFNSSATAISPNNFINYLLPTVMTIIVILFAINVKNKRYLILFYLAIFSLCLATLPFIPLFKELLQYTFETFPIFALFRSITRFSHIFFIASLLIISIMLTNLKYKKIATFILILLAFISGIGTLGNNKLNETIALLNPPSDYAAAKSITERSLDASVLILPSTNYDSFTWAYNTNTDAMQQIFLFYDYFFKNPIITERASLQLAENNPINKKLISEEIPNLKLYAEFNESLSSTKIGFILVDKTKLNPKSLDHIKYSKWIIFLDTNENVTKLQSNNTLNLYRVNNFAENNKQNINGILLEKPTHLKSPFEVYKINNISINDCISQNSSIIGVQYSWAETCMNKKVGLLTNNNIEIIKPFDKLNYYLLIIYFSLWPIVLIMILLIKKFDFKTKITI